MTEENGKQKENRTKENLEAVGQIIIGEIEKIGGILTADPVTQAEGDYNLESGSLHQKANKNLTASEESEETEEPKTEER